MKPSRTVVCCNKTYFHDVVLVCHTVISVLQIVCVAVNKDNKSNNSQTKKKKNVSIHYGNTS